MAIKEVLWVLVRCDHCEASIQRHSENPELEEFRRKHKDCGQPKEPPEPPCPVKHTKMGYFTGGINNHPILETSAVAIAFQAAVERGLVTIGWRTWFDGVTRNYYQVGDLCFDSIHAAVQAIWPITFAELEAP